MADQREPTLEELLSDPIILTVMERDGVRSADIRRLLRHVRTRQEQAALVRASSAGRLRQVGEIRPAI